MKNWGLNNIHGQIGEMYAAYMLAEARCAVNPLTGNDVGLDAHIQVPMLSDKTIDGILDAKSVNFQNDFAHIQIKYRDNGSFTPDNVDDVNSWIDSGYSTVPTMLMLVSPMKNGELRMAYFDPDLMNQLNGIDKRVFFDKPNSISIGHGIVFSKKEFLLNTHLWSAHTVVRDIFTIKPVYKSFEDAFISVTSTIKCICIGEFIKDGIPAGDSDSVMWDIQRVLGALLSSVSKENSSQIDLDSWTEQLALDASECQNPHRTDVYPYGWVEDESIIIPRRELRYLSEIGKLLELRTSRAI